MLSGGSLLVNGGVLNAGTGQARGNGGRLAIGLDGNGAAAVTVQNGGATASTVTAAYTVLGSDATSSGTLSLCGNGTSWTDAIDPNDTLATRGYILVGNEAQPFTVGADGRIRRRAGRA